MNTPTGTTIMAGVRWLILVAVTSVASITLWQYWGPGAHETGSTHEARYYCPMHPQIVSDRPGECPICHMDLEPIPARGGAMHPVPDSDSGIPNSSPEETTAVTLAGDQLARMGIATQRVERRALERAMRTPGVVEAPENTVAQVHVRAAGFIERVAVSQTGVRVSRGQALAWVYSPQVFQAQQELLTAHRWGAQSGGSPDSGIALLTGSPQNASIELAARRNLTLLGMTDGDIDTVIRTGTAMRAVPIRAPRPGYVTRREAVLGQYATPETVLYEIADLASVWVVASVFERDLPKIHQGITARFAPNGSTDPPVTARVELIEPDVSLETHTARVRLRVANTALTLRPGQYGDVLFDFAPEPALMVPRDAVVDTGSAQYVFVDRGGGRFEPVSVRVGALAGEDYPVLSGLTEGDRVVTRGTFMLDSESRLRASLAAPTGDRDAGGDR